MHCVHILFYLQALKVKNKSRSERSDFIYFCKAALWQYPLIKVLNCTNKAGLNYNMLALLKWTFSWYFYDSTPYHRMHLDIQCFQECDNEFASVTWTVSGSQPNQVSLGWDSHCTISSTMQPACGRIQTQANLRNKSQDLRHTARIVHLINWQFRIYINACFYTH